MQIARNILITPVDLTGHPQEKDASFVEFIRKNELKRLLDNATYTDSLTWEAREYRDSLFQELWPYYRDAQSQQIFLNTLLNNLLSEEVVSKGLYQRILTNMKKQY